MSIADDEFYNKQLRAGAAKLRKATAEIVAIDPGGEHVGVAMFREAPDSKYGWECWWVKEFQPGPFVDWFQVELPRFDVVVYEIFRLYEDKAMSLIGSEMETSQLIGVIKYLAGQAPLASVTGQPAAWQQPSLGILRSLGMPSKAKADRAGGHCLSAELHGWAYLIRSGLTRNIPINDRDWPGMPTWPKK